MRSETASRSGPRRLYEVLSSYVGPPTIDIPIEYRKGDSSEEDTDPSGADEDGEYTEDEDEDQSDVESSDEDTGHESGEESGGENAEEEEDEE